MLGKPCRVLLNTGALITVLVMSLAQRLGLVTCREETVKQRELLGYLVTWFGWLDMDVIKLDELVVVLKGGVVINTPGIVFPLEVEHIFGNELIVLSINRLQEVEMYQEFYLDGSSHLFMRQPKSLKQTGHEGKTFYFEAKTSGIENPLTVLVDTGADIKFCIT
ncbi:hypothetical protein E2C01_031374 [Portunus trituberculatus]|uniref:Peptidase A2 domain-containing protein n=1 Tax=Portunus trituberculatus TaxID=210409 RepID=A0A5B7EXY4_PORTR|nr:hypothetical protein [Portunus trituberculatus]